MISEYGNLLALWFPGLFSAKEGAGGKSPGNEVVMALAALQ